jgi:aminopeptidase
MVRINDSVITREQMIHADEKQYDLIAKNNLALMKKTDCYIAVRGSHNITENSDVPAEQMKMVMAKLRPCKTSASTTPAGCVLRWPTPAMAQQAGMSTQAFEDFFFRVCLLDYAASNRHERAQKAHGQNEGRPHQRPRHRSQLQPQRPQGHRLRRRHNIPDGEVFSPR